MLSKSRIKNKFSKLIVWPQQNKLCLVESDVAPQSMTRKGSDKLVSN